MNAIISTDDGDLGTPRMLRTADQMMRQAVNSGGVQPVVDTPDNMEWRASEHEYSVLHVHGLVKRRYPLTVNYAELKEIADVMTSALAHVSETYDRDPVLVYTGTSGVVISSAIMAALERRGVCPDIMIQRNELGLVHVKRKSSSPIHRNKIELSPNVDMMARSDRSMLVFVDDLVGSGQTYDHTLSCVTSRRSKFAHRDAFDVVMVPGAQALNYVSREGNRPALCAITGCRALPVNTGTAGTVALIKAHPTEITNHT